MLTDDQKKLRLTGIGGSEISAVVGLNPYAAPIDVFRAKKEGRELEVTEHMERGIFYEEPTARWWAHRHGATLREVGTIRHPSEEIVICTPDRLAAIPGQAEIDLSIKVPGPHTMEHWGPDGTDEIPDHYNLQVQWELIPLGVLFGIRRAVVTSPVHGELRSYPIEADADIQGRLVEAGKRFWRDHILTGKPPPPDASESYTEWLGQRYPTDTLPPIAATAEAEQWAQKLLRARRAAEVAEEAERAARNHLTAIMGEASGIKGDGWSISFKKTKDGKKTDWEAVALESNASPVLIQKHTTTKQGYRVFRVNGGNK